MHIDKRNTLQDLVLDDEAISILKKYGKKSYVYIMTNKYNNVLYTGVTNYLIRRVYEHKNKLIKGFSNKYNIIKLVYFEIFNDIKLVIER